MAEISKITEHEDGSATITLDMTQEETSSLLSWALKEAINNAVKMDENFKWVTDKAKDVVQTEKKTVVYKRGSVEWVDNDHIRLYTLNHPTYGEGVFVTSTVVRVTATENGGIYETRNTIYVPG